MATPQATIEASESMIAAAPKVMPPSSTRTSAAPWCPPTEFDDYVLVRLVGRGAMGAVYLAEDRLLARQVAIKFVATVEPGEQARRHFENEARAVARVQHPNVISIYRAGVLDDRPYLVTEYVRGEPLDQLPSPMPWAKVLEIGIDLARGLAAAHRRGVLHCDIKPQNAILTDDGQAKLVDFGLARLTQGRAGEGRGEGGVPAGGGEGPGAKQQTPGEGLIRGTPHFMAPELWRREPPSKRSDVYGLGALLFYLAAGLCPFEGIAAHELWRHVQRVDAPPLRSLSPTVDARFAAIVDRCLRRAASDRFASGDDLRDALEQLKRRASIAPPPSGNPYRGLRAFEADHRALFRGRDVEIGVILDRLRSEQLVVVTGDSGVGKSSICRAGVLPAVCEGAFGGGRMWTVFGVTPGERPLAAVAAAIAQFTGQEASWLEESARHHRGVLAEALAGRLGSDSGFLLFIDQAEELLTLSDPAERDAADAAVAALDALPGVRVLVSLRTDFLARFASLPNLGEDVARALYFLRPLSPDRVREVIVGPAEATGLRFESDEMVDELAAAAQAGGGLPLLQFALAELWEARDGHGGVIPRAALDALGGVGGALAKHADSVVLTLPPAQRAEARRMLVRLVTLDDTRARRSEAELGAKGPEARAALSALVRGRLLVAHEDEAGSAYELAHEVLIREWETLRRWLNEDVAKRGVRERLSAAAADWARAGRPKDVLWSARQLQEASALGPDDLGGLGGEFLRVSGLARRRERRARLAALVGAPLVVALAYGGALAKSRYETGRRVGVLVGEAGSALVGARAARAEVAALRAEAFRRFDARERAGGEEAWAAARARAAAAGRSYERASNALEAAFAQDPGRADVRTMLGQTLYERALLAESANDADKAAELSQRFALYDPEGDLARRWNEPALVSLAGTPPGAHVVLEGGSGQARELGQAPLGPIELARGSYVFALSAPGRAAVRYPVLVGRGERLELSVELPASSELPEGFVYVPPGRFLFGSADDEEVRRGFFDTTPRHEVRTGGYLVGRTEVTYEAWLDYLEALDPAERARRLPKAEAKIGQSGGLRLERRNEGWWLSITPSERTYEAHAGEKLLYVGRKERARQDWLKLPVTGISSEDFVAYAAWLDRTGRVPGARLCNEYEWERAARGADGRPFPHGDGLAGAEANYDETYGREGKGPDEVGTYPASKSPFGLDDTSGNAFEWVRSSLDEGQFVVRGGSYLHDRKTSQLANRAVVTPSLRDTGVGGRLCVTFFRLPALTPTRAKGQAP